jgi:hypothetical protein
MTYRTYRNKHERYIKKHPKTTIMSDRDFEIGRNAFERYKHNPNDGEWQRWDREQQEQEQPNLAKKKIPPWTKWKMLNVVASYTDFPLGPDIEK